MNRLLKLILGLIAVIPLSAQNLQDIPDQVIGRGGQFENIELSDYTDLAPADIFWEVAFIPPDTLDSIPDWQVDGAAFQFEMSITAQVSSKGTIAGGTEHILAAFGADGQVRGVATATQVDNGWLFFLTAYSNTDSEQLHFQFYNSDIQQVINVHQTLDFSPNSVVGDPLDPLGLEASILTATLDGSLLQVALVDTAFVGVERLQVALRTIANPDEVLFDTVAFTVRDNYAPQLEPIPDQIVAFDEEFGTIDLDDYIVLLDEDSIETTVSGQVELQVSIDTNRIVTIQKPAGWSGSETLTFTVTDLTDDAFSSSQQATFTGRPQDQAPVIIPFEDQVAGIGGEFAVINLAEHLQTNNPEAIKWSYSFVTDTADTMPDWSVNANDFQFSMSVTANVRALGNDLRGSQHLLAAFSRSDNQLVGLAQAIDVEGDWFFFLNVYNNNNSDTIEFKVYDTLSQRVLPARQIVSFDPNAILGDPLEPFLIEAGFMFPHINGNELIVELLPASGVIQEAIRMVATDTSTTDQLFDADTILFDVLDLTPPVLLTIPDQLIEEGEAFDTVNLAQYLEGADFDEVTWMVSGAEDLSPLLQDSLLSFSIPDEDYFGSTVVRVTATSTVNDQLTTFEEFELVVTNINDLPVFLTTPDSILSVGQLYMQEIRIEDADNDPLEISIEGLPEWMFFVPTDFGAILLGIPSQSDIGRYELILSINDGTEEVIGRFPLEVVQALGIDDNPKLVLYPNPATDRVFIQTGQPIDNIQVYDQQGRKEDVPYLEGNQSLDLRRLPKGVYFIFIHTPKGNLTSKLIKS